MGSKWSDAVRVSPVSGRVREPASGVFAVEVAPGASLQAAVDRCPSGGAILLRPGTHKGSVIIRKEVHVFGRGEATIRAPPSGKCIGCDVAVVTLDGLKVRGPLSSPCAPNGFTLAAILIFSGSARLQGLDINTRSTAVGVTSGADPVLFNCR